MWQVGFVLVASVFAAGWVTSNLVRPAVEQRRPDTSVAPVSNRLEIADLLDEHQVGVVVVAADGRIRYRNRAVERLTGTHVGVLLDEAIERHSERARSGLPSSETIEIYGPPRTVLVVEARPVRAGEAIVFVDDVSERRRIDQVRTDFVANISHELKTPVGAMSVLAETLEGESDPSTIERIVARIIGEAHRASTTIDDLLELSRIELGGERQIEPMTVDDVMRGALDRVQEMSAQRGIGISTLDPVASDGVRAGATTIRGDRRQLVSALGNLVENAVKYSTDDGAVQMRASVADGWLEIAVVDHGVGIPQRDLDRIFERFYRVDRARSRATGGTGLGLSIVRHVATNHGGAVLVSSTEGEGSTFVLRLPVGGPSAAGDDEVTGSHREGVA